MQDEATTRKVAMENCRKHGTGCIVETVFSRTCAALAAGGDCVGWGTDHTREAAEKRALSECALTGAKGCAIQTWVCSAPNAAANGGTWPSTYFRCQCGYHRIVLACTSQGGTSCA